MWEKESLMDPLSQHCHSQEVSLSAEAEAGLCAVGLSVGCGSACLLGVMTGSLSPGVGACGTAHMDHPGAGPLAVFSSGTLGRNS